MTLSNLVFGELPLVFFTVITQAAVGLSVVYALSIWMKKSHEDGTHKQFGILFIILILSGAIASLFHLGDPLNAPYMLTRIMGMSAGGTWIISWLPLEILGVGLMVVLGIIIVLKDSLSALYVLPIVGVLTLFAMSGIYGSMANTVPTWSFGHTFLLFCSSAVVLGGFLYRAVFVSDVKGVKISAFISLLGLVFFALSLTLYTLYIGQVRLDGIANVFELMHGYYGCFVGGGLLLVGLGLCLNTFNDRLNHCFTCKANAMIALTMSLLGILLTRIAFYGLITTHPFLG